MSTAANDPTPATPAAAPEDVTAVYGTVADQPKLPTKVRLTHLHKWKSEGHKWVMLTAYDALMAGVFDAAGVPVLLVGDSAANVVFGYETTLPLTMAEFVPLVRAVTRGARRAFVVADMPFGTYQGGVEEAVAHAVTLMKAGHAHAVKVEGGVRIAPVIEALVAAGIPVMGHVGFTPQAEHALGGYKVQGRGDAAEELRRDAEAVVAAGAFAVVLEMVPAAVAAEVTKSLPVPTIGIGAGVDCDAQVLVWQDFLGLSARKPPRFVKQYANLNAVVTEAVVAFSEDVRTGAFPASEHSF